jgi:hypothetical protein
MIFFLNRKPKTALAFLGRSASTSFVKAIIGKDKFNSFSPTNGIQTVHQLCEYTFKYQLIQNPNYARFKIFAVVRHPFERFQSAVNHTGDPFEYFIDSPLDVHTTSAYELIKGLKVNAYRFENGGVNNCARDMGLTNFEKINSTDHIISLTEDQKSILNEKYAKDIELWNSIDENGKEVFFE